MRRAVDADRSTRLVSAWIRCRAIDRADLHLVELSNAGRAEYAGVACAHRQLSDELPAQTPVPCRVTAEIREVRTARTAAHLEQLHGGNVVQEGRSHLCIDLARVEGAARYVGLQR